MCHGSSEERGTIMRLSGQGSLWKLNDSLESEKDLGKYGSSSNLLLYLLLPTGKRVNTDYKVKVITQVSMA